MLITVSCGTCTQVSLILSSSKEHRRLSLKVINAGLIVWLKHNSWSLRWRKWGSCSSKPCDLHSKRAHLIVKPFSSVRWFCYLKSQLDVVWSKNNILCRRVFSIVTFFPIANCFGRLSFLQYYVIFKLLTTLDSRSLLLFLYSCTTLVMQLVKVLITQFLKTRMKYYFNRYFKKKPSVQLLILISQCLNLLIFW